MKQASLFSGIDGFSLAASWMGWETLFCCEINEFCLPILKHHFPKSIHYGDIKTVDFTIWRGQVDVLTGGFPCQPFSLSGQRKGSDDDRYLWPEMLRAVREIRPTWVIGENVAGITSMVQPGREIEVESQAFVFEENNKETILEQEYVIETICKDLEREGYSVQPVIIPACAVGAPHRRDRIWFIANSDCKRQPDRNRNNTRGEVQNIEKWVQNDREINRSSDIRTPSNTNCIRFGREINRFRESGFSNKKSEENYWKNFPTQSPVCGANDGFSSKLDSSTLLDKRSKSRSAYQKWRKESIKSFGNAIVPQVYFEICKAIESVSK